MKKYGEELWTGFIGLRIGTSGGNENLVSIKGGKFLDELSDY
jgi:hypothetical protein